MPATLDIPTRSGGFGGADGFRSYLASAGIKRILDMTHPFATFISKRSAEIAEESGIPYLRYERPAWSPTPQDNWTMLQSESEAADHVEPGQVVFLATGRQTLERYANLGHATLICRQIDPPDGPFPFANGRFEIGRPPFSIADEVTLFRKLRVDVLVTKNAGGQASRSKLDAARELGLAVLMIQRSAAVPGPLCDNLEEVRKWLLEE